MSEVRTIECFRCSRRFNAELERPDGRRRTVATCPKCKFLNDVERGLARAADSKKEGENER